MGIESLVHQIAKELEMTGAVPLHNTLWIKLYHELMVGLCFRMQFKGVQDVHG